MESLRRVFDTIRTFFNGMSGSQKLLVGSLGVVLAMTLFLVQQYSGTPSMVPLLDAGYPAEDQQAAARFLDARGVGYDTGGDGVVMVRAASRTGLLAQMSQEPGALPSDTTLLFDNLIEQQSWTKNSQQNHQLETIAVQNEVSNILSQWSGIRSARVIIDVPTNRALGRPATAPTAAVTVFSEGGLSQDTVDAVAGFVSGSRAGLTPQRVRIIDGATGRQHRPREEGTLTAGDTQELIAKVEKRHRDKLLDMLSPYIPNVIVTVRAQVDATRRTTTTDAALNEGQGSTSLISSETATERSESQPLVSGEPGVRANNQADITSSGGGSSTFSESNADSQFDTKIGTRLENVLDPRGHATKINAVVNIPRDYFAAVWRLRQGPGDGDGEAAGGEGASGPTDEDLRPVVEEEVARIKRDIENVIDTTANEGSVRGEATVSMIPMSFGEGAGVATQAAGFLGLGGGGAGGVGGVAVDSLVKTVALGGLAVLALGLVVLTAMKTSKTEPLPSVEEMVGAPPALEGDDDIVGEAEAAEPALAGIELTEDAMKQRKVMEQVSDMISDKPEEAARLVGRWLTETH